MVPGACACASAQDYEDALASEFLAALRSRPRIKSGAGSIPEKGAYSDIGNSRPGDLRIEPLSRRLRPNRMPTLKKLRS